MSWGRCGRNVSCRITQFCTVIIVKMPSLNGSNGWTTSIFQILLIAQARSVLREQQLLMCYLVGFLNFVREKATEKTGYKFFDLSVHNFGVRFHVHTSSQGVRNILFYIRGKSVSSTVQLTPPVFSVSSFQGTYSLENKKNGGFAIDEPPQGSVNGPVDHSWRRAFYYRLSLLYKVFHLLFKW